MKGEKKITVKKRKNSGLEETKIVTEVPKASDPEKKKEKYEVAVINIDEAKRLYELGMTDEEIAYAFGCSTVTVFRSKARYPELRKAYEKGSAVANERVEQSLFKRANGFEYEEITKEPVFIFDEQGKKILKNPELKVVRVVKKVIPPDVGAISMWLRNKKADAWKDLKPVIIQNNQNNLIVNENKVKAEEVDESHIGTTRSNFQSLRKFGIIDAEVITPTEQN